MLNRLSNLFIPHTLYAGLITPIWSKSMPFGIMVEKDMLNQFKMGNKLLFIDAVAILDFEMTTIKICQICNTTAQRQ